MLNVLRHKGVSRKILWGVAVIIILSFGVFGTAYRLDHSVNSAGTIFGHSVSLRSFEKAYLASRDQAIMTYGDRFFKAGQNLDLEREAWSRLILLAEAKKHNLKATDKEVVDFIAMVPFFQHNGQFDQFLYESIVRNPSVFDRTPKDFEEGVRGSIVIRKLLDEAAGPVVLNDEELKKEYINRNEKIKLMYALFTPADFVEGLKVSDEEAQKYYAGHKDEFRQLPMANVQYVHLLYPAQATDAQKQAVKKDAIAIAHEATPQNDLAAIAAKYHQTAKDSGFFSQEQPLLTFAWSPDLVEKIFTMKPNEVSSPLEAPDGWQVIKLRQKQDAVTPEYKDIPDKVKTAAVNEKAYEAAKAKAEKILKSAEEKAKDKDFNFKAFAEGLKLKPEETVEFSRGEYINAPGLIAELQDESFKLNAGRKLGSVVSTSQGPAIVYLSSVTPIEEKKFTEDKEDFRQQLTAQKRSQAIAAFVTQLKFKADLKSDLKGKIRYQ